MNSTLKNIVVILLALTFAYMAYYLYIQNKNSVLNTEGGTVTEEVLKNTQLFIKHSTTLSNIKINTSVFENEVFLSYQSFTKPILEEPYGRSNPFTEFTQ